MVPTVFLFVLKGWPVNFPPLKSLLGLVFTASEGQTHMLREGSLILLHGVDHILIDRLAKGPHPPLDPIVHLPSHLLLHHGLTATAAIAYMELL